jgi:hypothetical protein
MQLLSRCILRTRNVECLPRSAHAFTPFISGRYVSSKSRNFSCSVQVETCSRSQVVFTHQEPDWGCSGPKFTVCNPIPITIKDTQRTFGLLQAGTPLSSAFWYSSEAERDVVWNSMGISRKKIMLMVDKIIAHDDVVISLNKMQMKIFEQDGE